MIVEAKDDMLVLSGSLTQNNWNTIRTAARLLLKRHPGGVIIDCGLIDAVTIEGAETFADALDYIENQKARIIVANVPPHVKEALSQVPRVRSQLPIVETVEAARASLSLSETVQQANVCTECSILAAISGESDEVEAVHMAARIAMQRKGIVHLLYCIEIPRAMPLGNPMPEKENHASMILKDIEALVKRHNVPVQRHIERARDWSEMAIKKAEELNSDTLVVTIPNIFSNAQEPYGKIINILKRANCEVLVYKASGKTPGA